MQLRACPTKLNANVQRYLQIAIVVRESRNPHLYGVPYILGAQQTLALIRHPLRVVPALGNAGFTHIATKGVKVALSKARVCWFRTRSRGTSFANSAVELQIKLDLTSLLVANLALSLAAGSDRTGLFYPDTMGHIRYRQIDVRLGNGGLPLSEISNIAATASGGSTTAPVHRQNVGMDLHPAERGPMATKRQRQILSGTDH
jgi:hypothetical protein